MAMAHHDLLPGSRWMSRLAPDGEPRNAVLLTGGLTLAALMMRDLNAVAPLLTMFFLITYSVINVVLLVESGLGLASFRPTLRVPWVVPLLGTLGSVFTMFVVNPTFGLVAAAVVVGIYAWILRKGVEAHGEDVRSSIFVALAEWAAAKVSTYDRHNVRAWKPNLLVPFQDPAEIRGEFPLLLDVARPEGSLNLLGLATAESAEELRPRVERLSGSFRRQGVFCASSVVETPDFTSGVVTSLQALQSAFFRPNVLFLTAPAEEAQQPVYGEIVQNAHRTGVGVLLLSLHPKAGLGLNGAINVWIREQPHWDVEEAFRRNNLNLSLLMGYRLARAWSGELNLVCAVEDPGAVRPAHEFLERLRELARLPASTRNHVLVGTFPEAATSAPFSDLAIVGLQEVPDFAFIRRVTDLSRASCLFVADSGRESALA
jgi:hypothetical protein